MLRRLHLATAALVVAPLLVLLLSAASAQFQDEIVDDHFPQCLSAEDLEAIGLTRGVRRPDLGPMKMDVGNWNSAIMIAHIVCLVHFYSLARHTAVHCATLTDYAGPCAQTRIISHDVLGYSVQYNDVGGVLDAMARIADDQSDFYPEAWLTGLRDNYDEMVLRTGRVLDIGATGFIGRTGLYMPTYMLDKYSDDLIDVWQLYGRSTEITSKLARSGSTPQALHTDEFREFVPEWCAQAVTPSTCIDDLSR